MTQARAGFYQTHLHNNVNEHRLLASQRLVNTSQPPYQLSAASNSQQ